MNRQFGFEDRKVNMDMIIRFRENCEISFKDLREIGLTDAQIIGLHDMVNSRSQGPKETQVPESSSMCECCHGPHAKHNCPLYQWHSELNNVFVREVPREKDVFFFRRKDKTGDYYQTVFFTPTNDELILIGSFPYVVSHETFSFADHQVTEEALSYIPRPFSFYRREGLSQILKEKAPGLHRRLEAVGLWK